MAKLGEHQGLIVSCMQTANAAAQQKQGLMIAQLGIKIFNCDSKQELFEQPVDNRPFPALSLACQKPINVC